MVLFKETKNANWPIVEQQILNIISETNKGWERAEEENHENQHSEVHIF